MHYTKRILTAVFLLLGFTAMAQSTAKKVTIDKIAAVVGDRIILESDIKNETATVTFTDLPKGEYAVSVYHDENANGVMDKNMFGIPSEDYAASNNAKGVMGPPKYADAKFKIETNSKNKNHA